MNVAPKAGLFIRYEKGKKRPAIKVGDAVKVLAYDEKEKLSWHLCKVLSIKAEWIKVHDILAWPGLKDIIIFKWDNEDVAYEPAAL